MFTENLLKGFHNNEEDDTFTKSTHFYQLGTINEYTHEWKVILARFLDLTKDQLLKKHIARLKPIIRSKLRLSRPQNLVETRNMAKMIKRELLSQQGIAFERLEKATNYNPQSHSMIPNNTTQKGAKRKKTIVADVERNGFQDIDVKESHYTICK
jgi:hypothetical protein